MGIKGIKIAKNTVKHIDTEDGDVENELLCEAPIEDFVDDALKFWVKQIRPPKGTSPALL